MIALSLQHDPGNAHNAAMGLARNAPLATALLPLMASQGQLHQCWNVIGALSSNAEEVDAACRALAGGKCNLGWARMTQGKRSSPADVLGSMQPVSLIAPPAMSLAPSECRYTRNAVVMQRSGGLCAALDAERDIYCVTQVLEASVGLLGNQWSAMQLAQSPLVASHLEGLSQTRSIDEDTANTLCLMAEDYAGGSNVEEADDE